MSTRWSNELFSCCSAYWRCDCSPDCCLASNAAWVVYYPEANLHIKLIGDIGRAAGINDCCPLLCLILSQLCIGTNTIGRSYLRTKVRQAKGIDGNRCTDCLTHCICGPCAVYQEARELNVSGVIAQQPTRA